MGGNIGIGIYAFNTLFTTFCVFEYWCVDSRVVWRVSVVLLVGELGSEALGVGGRRVELDSGSGVDEGGG